MSINCTHCNGRFTQKSKNTHAIICKNNTCILWFHHRRGSEWCSMEWIRQTHRVIFDKYKPVQTLIDNIVGPIPCNCGSYYVGLQTKDLPGHIEASGVTINNYHLALNRYVCSLAKNLAYILIHEQYNIHVLAEHLIREKRFMYWNPAELAATIKRIARDDDEFNVQQQTLLIRKIQTQYWEKEEEIKKMIRDNLKKNNT